MRFFSFVFFHQTAPSGPNRHAKKRCHFCIIYMWKQAQQEVRQHWFINVAVYIQVLCRLTRVPRTGFAVPSGVGSSPHTYIYIRLFIG